MQTRHRNRNINFQEQAYTTATYVIPYIEQFMPVGEETQVLEIGCGEGGNLQPFLEKGCHVTGIDLHPNRIAEARDFLAGYSKKNRVKLVCEDIYHVQENAQYDLIVMRDVLEHIHDQEKFLRHVKRFLKDSARFFLGFPPWQNPFGGHQQVSSSRYLSKMPYVHILPRGVYQRVLNALEKHPNRRKAFLEIKDTGITIERFNRIIARENYRVLDQTYYFINPNYEIKFNLKPRKQWALINRIPYLRNYLITTCYVIITKT